MPEKYYYSIPLFAPSYCNTLVNKIDSLAVNFHTLKQDYFYILGAASYQYKEKQEAYYQKAFQLNRLLWSNFADLYLTLLDKMRYFLQGPLGFLEYSGLPGFHIIEVGKQPSYYGGSQHFDLSYKQLVPDSKELLPHFSFTLSLQQPAEGAGLNIWNMHYADIYNAAHPVTLENAIYKAEKVFVPYKVGELVIFDGHYYHQIAPLSKTDPFDRRITLQGHCIKLSSGWAMYW